MTNTSPNPKLKSPHSKLKRQLKSPDLAFNPPLVKSLGGKELGELSVRRAELELSFNRRRRFDSTTEAILLSCGGRHCTATAFCLLSRCNELLGFSEESARRKALLQQYSLSTRKGLDPLLMGL